ncbi:MAG: NnrU family protein [Pseudomonadota bacterium]|nr:NnrU family protein [Pseudomonadota bacterium]
MFVLIAGLLLFFATHAVRLYADGWRSQVIAHQGELRWKGLYAVLAVTGLVLIVAGFAAARAEPLVIWTPPVWTRHLAALLVLLAFVLVTAAYVPRNRLKARLGHPMLAGVKTWAFAHLLANGLAVHVLLFGSFFVWALLDFVAARRRDRRLGLRYPAGTVAGDVQVLVIGVVAWSLFAMVGHRWLIGVSPFGG